MDVWTNSLFLHWMLWQIHHFCTRCPGQSHHFCTAWKSLLLRMPRTKSPFLHCLAITSALDAQHKVTISALDAQDKVTISALPGNHFCSGCPGQSHHFCTAWQSLLHWMPRTKSPFLHCLAITSALDAQDKVTISTLPGNHFCSGCPGQSHHFCTAWQSLLHWMPRTKSPFLHCLAITSALNAQDKVTIYVLPGNHFCSGCPKQSHGFCTAGQSLLLWMPGQSHNFCTAWQ